MNDINKPGQKSLRTGRTSIPEQLYLITTVTCNRLTLFDDLSLARKAIHCLYNPEVMKDNEWLSWVFMPDHFHGLLKLGQKESLSTVIGRFKGRVAREINRYRKQTSPVWQKSFHDHALRRDEDIRDVARYIVANPIRAGIVDNIADYPHWDSVWL